MKIDYHGYIRAISSGACVADPEKFKTVWDGVNSENFSYIMINIRFLLTGPQVFIKISLL